jgi:nucleoside phosphorylase
VIDFGAAGALDHRLQAGDCFVAETIVSPLPHGLPKTYAVPFTNFEPFLGEVPRFPAFSPFATGSPRVTSGPLTSGEIVTDSIEERSALARANGAIALCWEALAIADACRTKNVDFFSIRVISDSGQKPLHDEYAANVYRVLDQAASLLAQRWFQGRSL